MSRLARTLGRRVERCSAELLAAATGDWPSSALDALGRLTGADRVALLVTRDGAARGFGDEDGADLLRRALLRTDADGAPRIRRALWRHRTTPAAGAASAYDAIGVGARDDAEGAATGVAACAVADAPLSARQAAVRLQLLRAVRPALQASAVMHFAAIADLRRLGGLLDVMNHGALLCTPEGRPLLENAPLAAMAASVDDPGELRRALVGAGVRLAQAGRAAARPAADVEADADATPTPGVRELRAGGSTFVVRGAMLEGALTGGRPLALLTAERRRVSARVTAHELAVRFGLTARECEVAELLRGGLSNAEVAAALGISPFTARHHTERVLGKLGVRTRAAISGVFAALGGGEPTERRGSAPNGARTPPRPTPAAGVPAATGAKPAGPGAGPRTEPAAGGRAGRSKPGADAEA